MAKQALLVRTDWRADAFLAHAKVVFDRRKIFFAIPIFSKNARQLVRTDWRAASPDH
jgi:hypothetical protein